MNIDEVMKELASSPGDEYPEVAVEEILAHLDQFVPSLLEILDQPEEHWIELVKLRKAVDSTGGIIPLPLHLYAMYLLAQARERKAAPLIIRFFSMKRSFTSNLTDTLVADDLPRILASVVRGDPSLLQEMIENRTIDGYSRGAGLFALVTMVAQDELPRDLLVDYFRSLFQQKLGQDDDKEVWNCLVDCCLLIHPGELMAEIKLAYERNYVEPSFCPFEHVEEASNDTLRDTLLDLKENRAFSFITDAAEDLRDNITYLNDESYSEPYDTTEDDFEETPAHQPEPQVEKILPVKRAPKIGRNEPCPCGSGKKYKKCCLGKETDSGSGQRTGNTELITDGNSQMAED